MKNTISFFSFKIEKRQLLLNEGLHDAPIRRAKDVAEENEKKRYPNYKEHLPPRIPPEEIERLNKHIEEMNEKGWSVKSIQSIETGIYDRAFETKYEPASYGGYGGAWGYGYGWGYGASFTEGVIIYWEK